VKSVAETICRTILSRLVPIKTDAVTPQRSCGRPKTKRPANSLREVFKYSARSPALSHRIGRARSSSGRSSITPGTYFRMLLSGYFEGIDSERGISGAWPYAVHTRYPVMKWVLKVLLKHGLGRWPERMHRRDNLAGQRIDDESGAARLDRRTGPNT